MSARHIYMLAVAYTVLMVMAGEFGLFPHPGAIMLAVANVWFWIGRLSCSPSRLEDQDAKPRIKWGRQ